MADDGGLAALKRALEQATEYFQMCSNRKTKLLSDLASVNQQLDQYANAIKDIEQSIQWHEERLVQEYGS